MKNERFVSEPVEPAGGDQRQVRAPLGEPALPRGFLWRGREYPVEKVLEKWRETSPCRHGSGEKYLRKHWFRISTSGGMEMKVYFERQPRRGSSGGPRWWLFTLSEQPPEKE